MHLLTISSIKFLAKKCGITVTYVSGTDVNEFETAITDKTTLFYLESPASISFELQDLKAVANLAQNRGIKNHH